MDLKNKNAAVVIQPANIARKIAALGVNYERQFKNIIPGFIIAQPFVQEREIDNAIDEIHQSFSFQGFNVKTDIIVRKGEYKFEIGAVPNEDSRRLIDDLQVNLYHSMGIKYVNLILLNVADFSASLENSSVNAFIPLASFATETLAQKKLSEWTQIWGDYSFSVNELIVFTKQLGKPFTATDKTISLLVDEDEQDDVVMDGEWSNTQGDITDFSEFIEAATDADNRDALNSEASNAPMTLAHAETQSVLSTDVQEESVTVARVKVNKPASRARNNTVISDKSTRPTGSLGIAVDRVEKWIVESVYPEKLPKTRNKLMGCIRPFCIIVNKPDIDKIIKELVEEGFLDPETRYFTPCPHMGKYEIRYFFPKADEVRGIFHDFTTRNNTTFLQRHFDFTEHEDKILRQCRLIFTSEKAFEFPHKRESFMKKMYEMFETKEIVDPQKVIYRLIEEGLIDIDMDDNVTYFL